MASTEHGCREAGTCSREGAEGSPCQPWDNKRGMGGSHVPDHDGGCHVGCWSEEEGTPTEYPKRKWWR